MPAKRKCALKYQLMKKKMRQTPMAHALFEALINVCLTSMYLSVFGKNVRTNI